MSGGGSRGSYEAGAMWGMYNAAEDKSIFEYDVVTGVSAGAINAFAYSLFEKGDEVNALNVLSETWQSMTEKDLLHRWFPFGIVTGIKKHSGVFNTDHLHSYISNFANKYGGKPKRMLGVSAVDSNTGTYQVFNETVSDPIKAVMSSSAIPFVFPDQKWADGSVDMDGGSVWNLNLVTAVKRCREIVDNDSQINIDIVSVHSGKKLKTWNDRDSAVSNFLRFRDIQLYYNSIRDVQEFKQAFPLVNFRYYVAPTQDIPGGIDIINVNNATITWPLQVLGRSDGANAVKGTKPGESFKQLDEDYAEYLSFMKGNTPLEFMQ